MSATIPVPLHPPKIMSSDPLQDDPTSYVPPTLTERTGHILHNLLTKWTPPDRVKRVIDSAKQKQENPHSQRHL